MAEKRRRTGKNASIYYNGVLIAEAFDVEPKIDNETIEHVAFGDKWKHREQDVGDWSVSANRYSAVGGTLGFSIDAAATQAESGTPLTIAVYQVDGDATTKIIEGPIFVQSGSLSLKRQGMVEEPIEFVAADDPTYWIGK